MPRSTRITTGSPSKSNEGQNVMPQGKQPSSEDQPRRETVKKSIIWARIGKEPLTIAELALFQEQLIVNANLKEMGVKTNEDPST